jgi:hypothetical protein
VEEYKSKYKETVKFSSSFSLSLRNVGLGAAKEVTLKWSFPIENIVSSINKKAQTTLTPIYFDYKNEVLSIRSERLHTATSMWGNQKCSFVDYVLPASIDQYGIPVHLPPAYIELVSALIFLFSKDDVILFPEIPALKLELEFFDIGGAKRNSYFDIDLSLGVIYKGGEGFHGYLQSKKSI